MDELGDVVDNVGLVQEEVGLSDRLGHEVAVRGNGKTPNPDKRSTSHSVSQALGDSDEVEELEALGLWDVVMLDGIGQDGHGGLALVHLSDVTEDDGRESLNSGRGRSRVADRSGGCVGGRLERRQTLLEAGNRLGLGSDGRRERAVLRDGRDRREVRRAGCRWSAEGWRGSEAGRGGLTARTRGWTGALRNVAGAQRSVRRRLGRRLRIASVEHVGSFRRRRWSAVELEDDLAQLGRDVLFLSVRQRLLARQPVEVEPGLAGRSPAVREGEQSLDDDRAGGEVGRVRRRRVLLSRPKEEAQGGDEDVDVLGEQQVGQML